MWPHGNSGRPWIHSHPCGGGARFQIPESLNPRFAIWKSTPTLAHALVDFRVAVGDSEFLESGISLLRRMDGSVSMVYLNLPGAPWDTLGPMGSLVFLVFVIIFVCFAFLFELLLIDRVIFAVSMYVCYE